MMFRRQALDVASRVTLDGPVPEVAQWIEPIALAAQPTLLKLTQQGMVETQMRLAGKRRGTIQAPAGDGFREHVLPVDVAFGMAKTLTRSRWRVAKAAGVNASFDLFNPRTIDAVNSAAFTFCRETMETARSDLATALADLRRLLRGGLQRGEALRLLAEKVHAIFADPYRATRIAVTEASRAIHGGNFIAAKDAGATHKEWNASADACDLCLSIAEKGPIPIDDPFHVDHRQGPYAVCMFPPVHPFDMCSYSEVMAA